MWEVNGIQVEMTVSWKLQELQEQYQKLTIPDVNPWAASLFKHSQPNDIIMGIVTLQLN